VGAVVEQNAAAAEEVSTAAEQTSAQIDTVASSAARLEALSEQLAGLVSRFRLAEETVAGEAATGVPVIPRRRSSDWMESATGISRQRPDNVRVVTRA
jgi:hypothetical protein